MQKNIQRIFSLGLMVSFLLTACGGNPPKPNAVNAAPLSTLATQVENVNAKEVLVRATGEDVDLSSALADGRKAALWSQLYGPNGLMQGQDSSALKVHEAELWANPARFITYESGLKSKEQIGDKIRATQLIRINRAELEKQLVSWGVYQTPDKLTANVGGLPSLSLSGDNDAVVRILGEHLLGQGYSLKNNQADSRLAQSVQSLAQLEKIYDPAYSQAMERGADVYIKVDSSLSSTQIAGINAQQAQVSFTAYDTTTALILASATGYSAERAGAPTLLLGEAAQDAAGKLTQELRQNWIKVSKEGQSYKLFWTAAPGLHQEWDIPLYQALKALKPKQLKREVVTESQGVYLIKIHGMDSALDLFLALQAQLKLPGLVEKRLDQGRLLQLHYSPGNAGEMILQ